MRRFFGTVNEVDNSVSFSEDTSKHIKVIRLNLSENFEVVSNGEIYLCNVINLNPFFVEVLKKISQESERELNFDLILFCPLLKNGNFELALQKSVELGVKEIYPYISSRVIKRVSKQEFNSKKSRYEKIISAASEQSNRTIVPVLHDLQNIEELNLIESKYKLIAFENEAIKGEMIPVMTFKPSEKVICLIGPEGGFSQQEVNLFISTGFQAVSLGKRILRAETAVFYMLSVVGYNGEKNNE